MLSANFWQNVYIFSLYLFYFIWSSRIWYSVLIFLLEILLGLCAFYKLSVIIESLISETLFLIFIFFFLIYDLGGILKFYIFRVIGFLLAIVDNTPLSRLFRVKRSEISETVKIIRWTVERYRDIIIDVAY